MYKTRRIPVFAETEYIVLVKSFYVAWVLNLELISEVQTPVPPVSTTPRPDT
jgi:hypothetical protein